VAPEIKFWKNPGEGLEKSSKLRQNIPICWHFQKLAKGSMSSRIEMAVGTQP
jgi:hypothetical protein